jgi:hypothetical protein
LSGAAAPVPPAKVLTGDDLPGVLLRAADLPAGWTPLMAGTGNAASEVTGCGATAATQNRRAAAAFSRAVLGPYLAETLSIEPAARETVDRLRQVIADCAQVSVTPLDVPAMGDDSTAFALEAGIPGVGMSLHGQVVAVSRGDVLMTVTVAGMSPVDTANTVQIARTALAKLG